VSADLRLLDAAVKCLLGQEWFETTLARLEGELMRSKETFVWATVDLETIPLVLPDEIKSGWIFRLRWDVPSGAHYHPNSVQHMTVVAGAGEAVVSGESRTMVQFQKPAPMGERWLVIDQNAAHEFVPVGGDMTVVSFHTCGTEELEEIECDTGGLRHYEGSDA
jgi:hypothetical protein